VRPAVGPFTRAASIPLAAVSSDSAAAALLPAVTAVPHLPHITLAAAVLDTAIRGGLIDVPPGVESEASAPAATLAACDEAGDLVGILQPHASGQWRLRPNFRGVG